MFKAEKALTVENKRRPPLPLRLKNPAKRSDMTKMSVILVGVVVGVGLRSVVLLFLG